MAEIEPMTNHTYDDTYYDTYNRSYEYRHFETIRQCEIHILNNPHITVAYKCCNGRGYATPNRSPPTRILTKKPPEPMTAHDEHTTGTCDICFIDDKKLYFACDCCKGPICMDCLQQLRSKVCPYCRGTLKI